MNRMLRHPILLAASLVAFAASAPPAAAEDGIAGALVTVESTPQSAAEPSYLALQRQWEQARYGTPPDARLRALESAADAARVTASAHPEEAEVLIWKGIVLASLAGEKGGLGALSLCKEARAALDAAIALEPTALSGSAYTTLGSLYYQVPGWPIGFGDEERARELLQKALSLDPHGIDSNYFWGDYLREQGDYRAAVDALEHALAAPPRAGRELADQGRRSEIERALAEARKHLRS
jgi:tetratricopeptide (TPR) repeat protein